MVRNTAAAILLLTVGAAAARADLSKEEFLAEYEPALEQLVRFYGAVTISATMHGATRDDPSGELPQKVVIRANGPLVRADVLVPKDRDALPEDGIIHAVTAAPKSAFFVTRAAGKASFVLERMGSDYETTVRRMRSQVRLIAAPYGFIDVPVVSLIKLPNWRLTAIDEINEDDEHLVRVSFLMDNVSAANRNMPSQFQGWFLFSKDLCWALRGYLYRATISSQDQLRATIKYDRAEDGMPLLKHAEYWSEADGRRDGLTTFDVTDFVRAAPPESAFQLAAFGIRGIHEEEVGYRWLLILFAGVLLVGVSLLLLVVRVRKGAISLTR